MNAIKVDIEIYERNELDDIDHEVYYYYSARIFNSETGQLLYTTKEFPLEEELFIDIMKHFNVQVKDLSWYYE